MKKVILICVIVFGTVLAFVVYSSSTRKPATPKRDSGSTNPPLAYQAPRVPAYHKDAASARPLKPTLDPALFVGKTRQAYQVAKEIPETLAQLPCYCYCDSMGHKSLHTCYEDDHSAHCVTCTDEALMAYRLQKEQNLTPAQIRVKIIEEFSK
jgi:hypothetical protein